MPSPPGSQPSPASPGISSRVSDEPLPVAGSGVVSLPSGPSSPDDEPVPFLSVSDFLPSAELFESELFESEFFESAPLELEPSASAEFEPSDFANEPSDFDDELEFNDELEFEDESEFDDCLAESASEELALFEEVSAELLESEFDDEVELPSEADELFDFAVSEPSELVVAFESVVALLVLSEPAAPAVFEPSVELAALASAEASTSLPGSGSSGYSVSVTEIFSSLTSKFQLGVVPSKLAKFMRLSGFAASTTYPLAFNSNVLGVAA